jgi:hypothetical protein
VVCRAFPSGEATGSSVPLALCAASAVLSGDPRCRLAAAAAGVGRLGMGAMTVQQQPVTYCWQACSRLVSICMLLALNPCTEHDNTAMLSPEDTWRNEQSSWPAADELQACRGSAVAAMSSPLPECFCATLHGVTLHDAPWDSRRVLAPCNATLSGATSAPVPMLTVSAEALRAA